jgi:hypothetical protein
MSLEKEKRAGRGGEKIKIREKERRRAALIENTAMSTTLIFPIENV